MGIHPHHEQIAAELQSFMDRVTGWSGEVYRSATPRYCRSQDLVSGLGSAKMGGRWNPPGDLRTVYASLDPETAMAESLANFRYYGWALYEAMPRVFQALEVRLSAVLSLEDLPQPISGRLEQLWPKTGASSRLPARSPCPRRLAAQPSKQVWKLCWYRPMPGPAGPTSSPSSRTSGPRAPSGY